MESARITELLRPFTGAELPPGLPERLQIYLDLLLRWNGRVNLTAVRDPEQIVTRHFGESLFAARILLGDWPGSETATAPPTLVDVGSGAGFPGIPIKMWAQHTNLKLIESQNKKNAFLREVVRTLGLEGAEVFCGRAEQWGQTASFATLRAVERFERVLPVAASLVVPGGSICLLVGTKQVDDARTLLGHAWAWNSPVRVPLSVGRVVAVATKL